MNVYFFTFSIVCVFAMWYPFFSEKGKKVLYVVACIIPTFLICCRDVMVGADTLVYFRGFCRFQEMEWIGFLRDRLFNLHEWEPGYIAFQKVLGYFVDGADSNNYIFVMGLVCLIPLFLYLNRWSTDPILSLLVFLTFNFTSAETLYRAWLALLISLFSHQYIIDREWKRFLFVVFVAALFHRTALVLLPVYVLFLLRPTGALIFGSIFIASILGLTGGQWLSFFSQFTRNPLVEGWRGGVSMLFFMWLVLLGTYFMARRRLTESRFRLWFIMLWIAAVTQPLCFTFPLWSRLQMFFMLSTWTLLPEAIVFYSKIGENRLYSMFIRLVFMALLGIHFYLSYRDKVFVMGAW